MIDIVSYAKKKTGTSTGGGSIGGIGTGQISTPEPHVLWGQMYDGRHDISGDLKSEGTITAKGLVGTTGTIDTVIGQELRYTTIIGGSISATDSTITNLTTTSHTTDSLTTNNLDSRAGTITDLTTQTSHTQELTAKNIDTERLSSKDVVVDNLTVNKAAHFFSLSIDEIKATQGQIVVSPASTIIEKVEVLTSGDYKCSWKNTDTTKTTTQTFTIGDLVVCQIFNTQPRYYWRLCTEAGSSDSWNYIVLSKTDKDPSSISEPMKGDNIVQLGNKTDTTRQAAIIISAYNTGYLDKTVVAPSIVQYSGINDYNLEPHRQNIISVGKNIFKGEFLVYNGKSLESYLKQTADQIKTQVQNNKNTLDTVTGKVRQAESSISSLTQKANSIEQSVAGTRTELDNLKNTTTQDINTLRQTATETVSKISNVENTVRNFSVGGQNLLNGVIDFRQLTPLLQTSKNRDGWIYYRSVVSEQLIAGKTYTLQLKSDGVLARDHVREGERSYTVWLCGKTDNLVFTSSNKVGDDCVWTFTCPTTDTYQLRLNSYGDGTNYESIKFWDIKLEEGNIVSGWSPSSDDLYKYYSSNRVGFDFVQNFPNDHHPAQSISYNHSTDTIRMVYEIEKAGGSLQDIDYTVLFNSNSINIPNGRYLVKFKPILSSDDVRLRVELDNKVAVERPIDYSMGAISGHEVSRIIEVTDNYLRIYFESAFQEGQDRNRTWWIDIEGLEVVRVSSAESYLKQTADLIEAKIQSGDIVLDASRVKVKNGDTEAALFEDGKIKTDYLEGKTGIFSINKDGFYYKGEVSEAENETVTTKIHNHGISSKVSETKYRDGIYQSVSLSPYSRDTNLEIVSNSEEAVSISSVSSNLQAALKITDGAVLGLRGQTKLYRGGNHTLDTYVKNVIVTGASDTRQVGGNLTTNLRLPDNETLTRDILEDNPTSAERIEYISKYHKSPENLQAGQEYIIYKRSSGVLVIGVDDVDPRKTINILRYSKDKIVITKSVTFPNNWVGVVKVLFDGQDWNLTVDSVNY